MKKKNTLYLKRRLKCYSLSPFRRGGIIFNTVDMHLIFLGYFPVHPWGQYLSTLSLGIVLGQNTPWGVHQQIPSQGTVLVNIALCAKAQYWIIVLVLKRPIRALQSEVYSSSLFLNTQICFQYLCGSKYHKKSSLSRGLKYSKCLGVVGPSLLALTRAEFMQITALLCSAARMQIQEDSDLLQNNLKQK